MPSEIQKLTGSEAGLSRVLIDIDELFDSALYREGRLYNWVYLRSIPFVKLSRALRFDPVEIERMLQDSSTMEIAGSKRWTEERGQACWAKGNHLAHFPAHVCIPSRAAWGGHRDREDVARAFDDRRQDALCAFK